MRAETSMQPMQNQDVVPVTMLSGFLGAGIARSLANHWASSVVSRTHRWCAGKTTLLRNLLENTKLKIGCIVNDVASVNVDAKLIRNDRTRDRASSVNTTTDLADTIELANGCACECFCVLQRRAISSKKTFSTVVSPSVQAAASLMNCSTPSNNF